MIAYIFALLVLNFCFDSETAKNIEIGKRLRDLSTHFSVLLRKSCSVQIRTYFKKLRTFCRRRLSAPSHDRVGNFLKIICDQENTKSIHFFSIVLSRESHSLTLVATERPQSFLDVNCINPISYVH